MQLIDRVENCLTGIVLLDLFRILAEKETSKRHLPKGVLWMANQTHTNLQATAKGLVLVALSKSPEGNLFRHGHGRLSELPIEEWFGRIRSRSSTAQLSCRTYWKSAAKEMIRQMHNTNRRKGESDREKMEPIGPSEFRKASERAFKAACQLAAVCGGVSQDSSAAIYAENSTPTSASEAPLHA